MSFPCRPNQPGGVGVRREDTCQLVRGVERNVHDTTALVFVLFCFGFFFFFFFFFSTSLVNTDTFNTATRIASLDSVIFSGQWM